MKPNDFGKISVEDCESIGLADFLKQYRRELKVAMLNATLKVSGVTVDFIFSRTGYGGERIWFKCPLCGKRAGIIFKHPQNGNVGCRACLGLTYHKRRYKGMVESSALR